MKHQSRRGTYLVKSPRKAEVKGVRRAPLALIKVCYGYVGEEGLWYIVIISNRKC